MSGLQIGLQFASNDLNTGSVGVFVCMQCPGLWILVWQNDILSKMHCYSHVRGPKMSQGVITESLELAVSLGGFRQNQIIFNWLG